MPSAPGATRALPLRGGPFRLILTLFFVAIIATTAKAALNDLKVLTDRDLEVGLFRRDFSRMEPNATFHGVPGVFIPHASSTSTVPMPTQTTTTTGTTTTSTTSSSTTTSSTTTPGQVSDEETTVNRKRGFLWGSGERQVTEPESTTTSVHLVEDSSQSERRPRAFLWFQPEGSVAVEEDSTLSTVVLSDEESEAEKRKPFMWFNVNKAVPENEMDSETSTTSTIALSQTEAGSTESTIELRTEEEDEAGPRGFLWFKPESASSNEASSTTTSTTSRSTQPSTTDVQVVTVGKDQPSDVTSMMKATSLVFSNLPPYKGLPSIDIASHSVSLDMYANEPCTIGAFSANNKEVWVDLATVPTNTTGAVARESWVSVIPRGEIGSVQNMTLWLTDTTHETMVPVTIHARLVESQNPNLAHLEVSPGRLDPVFHPQAYGYFVRVPEGTKSLVLDFALMNDKHARCTLDGDKEYIGRGKALIKVPKEIIGKSFELYCSSADNSQSVRYILSLVRQFGGETTLASLGVAGAALNTPFDPLYQGPYAADLIRGAQRDGGQELEWTQVRAVPSNPSRAIVSIAGVKTDAEIDWRSGWFRVPRGEKRRISVSVTTPTNPVAEVYTVDLTREVFGASWHETARGRYLAGRTVSGLSTLLGASSNAGWLMNNLRFGQMLSALGRQPDTPEYYDNFASAFKPLNLQGTPCVMPVAVNGSYPEGYPPAVDCPGGYSGRPIPQYQFQWLELSSFLEPTQMASYLEPEELLATMKQKGPKPSPDRRLDHKLDFENLAGYEFGELPAALFNWGKSTPATQHLNHNSEEGIRRQLHLADYGLLEGFEEVSTLFNRKKEDSSVLLQDPSTTPKRRLKDFEHALADEVLGWADDLTVYEFNSKDKLKKSAGPEVGRPRRLTPLSPADRAAVVGRLEAARKAHENVQLYAITLTTSTLILISMATLYGIIWFSYLASPGGSTKSLDGAVTGEEHMEYELAQPLQESADQDQLAHDVEDISAGGCHFAMRADYPTVLHPVRVFSWMCDFAFIAYTQASVGILMAPSGLFSTVSLFGGWVVLPLVAFKGISAVILCVCVGYLLWGTACLIGAQSRVVFGPQFCEYHDSVMTKAKAIHRPRWARWLGSFSRLFDVEISGVAPLQAASDRESRAVVFDTTTDVSPIASHYGYDRVSTAEQPNPSAPPQYRRFGDAIEVAINDRLYTSIIENYDRHNAAFVERYPEAKLGETEFLLNNAYGYPIKLTADLQLKHITSLMQLMDNFPFWLPRDNCQMPVKDALFNLFSQAGRGLFLDWAVNRSLLFIAIVAGTILATTSLSSGAILILAGYGLLSGLLRTPFAAATGMSKYTRDLETWEKELDDMRAACAEAREAENIWPFNEPGFSERFRQLREKKRRAFASREAQADKIFYAASPETDTETALAEMAPNSILRTPTWYVLKEVLLCAGFADILFGCIALVLFFHRRSHKAGFGQSPLPAIVLALTAVLLLNIRPAKMFWDGLCRVGNELASEGAWFTVATHDLFFGIGGLGARLTHFSDQFGKWLAKDPTHNWHFPKTGRAIRRFPVEEATIVSNELGMHLDARAVDTSTYLKATVPDQNRLKLFKTLVVKGGLGDSRRDIYRSLPVQVPFCRLFAYDGNGFALRLNGDQPIERLVATVQVVNHTFRANAAGLPALKDSIHDSFLSLYANPDFFPAPGKIRLRKSGHTYSVRFDPDHSQLIVRGPAIVAGRQYTLFTSQEQPNRKDMYQNAAAPAESVSEDSVYPERTMTAGSASAICRTPGALRVEVPGAGSMAPDLYRPIEIQTPLGTVIELNPMEIKVHYDIDCSELFLRHEEFLPAETAYRVMWYVKPQRGVPVRTEAFANANGTVIFDVPAGQSPDLESWLTLRDDKRATIDIDPKQTDAYQIFFPERASNQHCLKIFAGRMRALANYFSGDEKTLTSRITEEPIPCTVVQCVNPVERIFRVDPDFHEAHRVLKARVHELRAQQRCIDTDLPNLWPAVLSTEEYVAFWKNYDVATVDDMGHMIDPLGVERDDERFASLFKEIAMGDVALRSIVSQRMDEKIGELEAQMDRVRVWIRAYNDPNLHTAQLERDRADWNLRENDNLESQSLELKAQKEAYEAECENFVYPCNVPDCFIARRPNLAAQFRLWLDHLQSWLICEEGCDVTSKAGQQRVAAVAGDVMQALKLTLFSNEARTAHDYRSVLHYAVSSHMLRGLDTFWCPDSIKAHPACVRAWTVKEDERTADFDCLPERIPCLLRLTPNALQILMPNAGDLSRVCKDTDYCWQNSTGLYIPLHAFQKFEIQRDAALPAATSDPKPFAAMTTKLICRKNQQCPIDDAYVRRTEDGQIGNDITFDDATGNKVRFRIMLGHCVSPREVRDRTEEIDPSIEGSEVNIYPLTFNMNPAFADQWERAIDMARLREPHNFEIDGTIRPDETVSSSSEPPPPPPVARPAPPPPIVVEEDRRMKPELNERQPRPSDYVLFCKEDSSRVGRADMGPQERMLYEGEGKLLTPEGQTVYSGSWEMGQRHSQNAEYHFHDESNRKWTYRGAFNRDHMVGHAQIVLAPGPHIDELRSLSDTASPKRLTPLAIEGPLQPPRGPMTPAVSPQTLTNMVPATILKAIFDSPRYEPDDEDLTAALREFIPARAGLSPTDRNALCKLVSSMYWRDSEIICDADAEGEVLGNAALVANLTAAASEATESDTPRSPLAGVGALLCNIMPHRTRWRREYTEHGVALVFGRLSEGTLRLADGSLYRGATVEGFPHGEGQLSNDLLHMRYQGGFDSGKPNGYGTLEHMLGRPDFAAYYGGMKLGLRHGEGQLNSWNDQVYVRGDWGNDQLAGTQGCSVIIDPTYAASRKFLISAYEGKLDQGRPTQDDSNTTHFTNGLTYIGGFDLEGKRHGRGRIVRYDTQGREEILFSGHFKKNLPDGPCSRYVLSSGQVYVGNMVGGYRHGMGEMYRQSEGKELILVYEGLWFEDRPNGRGMYIAEDGEYDGEWKSGKRQGKGRFTYKENHLANGKLRVYEGNWHNDKPHGVGRYLSQSAADNVYRFDQGVIVEQSVNSYAPACCGSAPELTKNEAAVKPAEFTIVVEKDACWDRSKTGVNLQHFKQVLNEVTTPGTWKDYLKHYQLQDPNRPAELMSVSRLQPVTLSATKKAGAVAAMTPPVAPTGPHRDVVKLFVLEGRAMKCGSKSDPYVKVTYGSTTKKTKRINSGGPNCKFNKTLLFPAEANVTEMSIEVYDSDRLSSDDFIGRAMISLEALKPGTEEINKVVNLQHTKNGKREDRGQIIVSLFRTSVSDLLTINPQSSQNTNASVQAAYGPHLRATIHNVKNIKAPAGSNVAPAVQLSLGHKDATTATGNGINVPFDETLCIPYNGSEQASFALVDRSAPTKPATIGTAIINIKDKPEFSGELKFESTTGQVVGVLDVSLTLKK